MRGRRSYLYRRSLAEQVPSTLAAHFKSCYTLSSQSEGQFSLTKDLVVVLSCLGSWLPYFTHSDIRPAVWRNRVGHNIYVLGDTCVSKPPLLPPFFECGMFIV